MIPLKLNTEKNQKAYGRDVKYLVKFDWQNDNWKAKLGYDQFSQCYELTSGNTLLDIGDWDSSLTMDVGFSGSFGMANPWIATSGDNSGNGYIGLGADDYPLGYELSGEGESFLVLAVDNEEDDSCSFIVKCDSDKDIGLLYDAELNTPYGFENQNNNGYLKFKINQGDSKFLLGDSFNIYPAISTKELNQTATLTNGIDNFTNFIIEGGPDFLYWTKVSWISEGDVRVHIRTCNDITSPRWSDWYSYENNEELVSEQSRRYLQFKIVLTSTSTVRAKLAQLNFTYEVKAHTNNEDSIYYEKNFNDVVSIKISRSKDFVTAGYRAADCDIVLNNSHRQYSGIENSSSIYFNKVNPRLRFIIEMGFDEQTVQKIEAFASSFKLNTSNRTISIHGQDYVKQFIAKKIDSKDITSRVFVDKPVDFLVKMIALDVGFPLEKLNLEDTTITDVVPYAYFRGKEAWKAIQDLLLGYEGEVYIDESGYLTIRDRFKRKNIYRSPRYSSKNVIQSIAYNNSNEDLLMVVNSEEYDSPFLYLYNVDYTNIDTGVLGLVYCAEDQIDVYSSIIGVKSNKLIRITGDSEIPSIEDILSLSTFFFTNRIEYQATILDNYRYLYGVLYNGTKYMFYRYKLLDQNNILLYEADNPNYKFLVFDAFNESILMSPAKNIKKSILVAINSITSAETVLVYGTDWEFTNQTYTTVKLLIPYVPINSYLFSYVSINPVSIIEDEISEDITIYYPEKLMLDMENSDTFFSKCIINIPTGIGYDGQVLLVNFNSSGNLYVIASAGGIQYEYTSDVIQKYYGGACDIHSSKVYLFVLTSDNKKKILSFDISSFNEIVDTGDEVLINDVDDSLLKIYDVKYNEIDKYTYISCGYSSDVDKDAYLLRYKQSHVDVDWKNTVGKPLDKVVVKDTSDTDAVADKQYNIFFQKRGGIGATTSQIWSWFSYTRRNEDKLKTGIKETVVTCSPVTSYIGVDNYCATFELDGTDLEFSDLEYVYKSDPNEGWVNIGDNFYKDTVNNYIVLTSSININTTTLRGGSGKKLKKYFGEYFKINSTSTPNWNNLPLASYPYKPTKLRFYGDDLSDGTISISGYAVGGAYQSELLNYTSVSGYVESEYEYDKEYYGQIGISAENVKGVLYSTLTCESTYEDLIPGIDVYAYVNPDDTENQFGGNGLVTSFTQESAIDVNIKDGLEVVNKIPSEKALTSLDISDTGRVYGATSYTGKLFLYEKNKIIEGLYDYELSYDYNITKLNYDWSDSDIKNSITITAKKKEASPYRESEIMTGILISDIPESSHLKDWFRLEKLYKTESPRLLAPGDYYEADINFSNPVLTHEDNVMRFNSHVSDYAGTLLSGDNGFGIGYYLNKAQADHSGNVFDQVWNDEVQFKLNPSFMSLGGSGQFNDPYTGDSSWINIAEAEKRNMEIYIGSRKLYYTSGEYSADISGDNYILNIPIGNNHINYVGAGLTIHYPIRWNVPQTTLERNIDTSGELTNDYLWSRIYDVDYPGIPSVGTNDDKLKYYYVDRGGFQLDVLWPNKSTYAETTYLRAENPAVDALDAYFDPEAHASGWRIWLDKIELRGLPIIETPVTISTQKDLDSIDKYFEQTYSLDNEYIQTVEVGNRLAKYILQNSSTPFIKPSVGIVGCASLQIGDSLAIKDSNTNLDGDIFEVLGITENMAVGSVYSQDLELKKIYDKKAGVGIYNESTFDNAYVYK